jgi:hypothetical protein
MITLEYYTDKNRGDKSDFLHWKPCDNLILEKNQLIENICKTRYDQMLKFPSGETTNLLQSLMFSDGTIYDVPNRSFRDEEDFPPQETIDYMKTVLKNTNKKSHD